LHLLLKGANEVIDEQVIAVQSTQAYRYPSLTYIYDIVHSKSKARVLDLGAPSSANFNFFRQFNCHIRFEDFTDFVTQILDSEKRLSDDDFIFAINDYLSVLDTEEPFDIIISWDIFCYLNENITKAVSDRLAKHCSQNGILQVVRYWGALFPSKPRSFYILDSISAKSNYEECQLRYFQKLPSLSQLDKSMVGFTLDQSFIEFNDMHPSMTEAIFSRSNSKKLLVTAQDKPIRPPEKISAPSNGPIKSQLSSNHISHALGQLFTDSNREELRVLDLSFPSYNSETFYKTNCKDNFFARLPNDGHEPTIEKCLQSLKSMQHNQYFDVIMGWDLFNRYNPEIIRKIIVGISPYINAKSRLYLLQYMGKNSSYSVIKRELLGGNQMHLSAGLDNLSSNQYSIFKLISAIKIGHIEQRYLFKEGMHQDFHEYVIGLVPE
jgi:hypothetical protein